jgi:hypothetical protein
MNSDDNRESRIEKVLVIPGLVDHCGAPKLIIERESSNQPTLPLSADLSPNDAGTANFRYSISPYEWQILDVFVYVKSADHHHLGVHPSEFSGQSTKIAGDSPKSLGDKDVAVEDYSHNVIQWVKHKGELRSKMGFLTLCQQNCR